MKAPDLQPDSSEPAVTNRSQHVARVFISHAMSDKATADAVRIALENRGIACWVATRDIRAGENFTEAIIEALSASPLLVLILTPAATLSPHVPREVELAVSSKIRVVAIKTGDFALPPMFRYLLSISNWLQADDLPTSDQVAEFVERVAAILADESTEPSFPPPSGKTRRRWILPAAAAGSIMALGLAYAVFRIAVPVAAGQRVTSAPVDAGSTLVSVDSVQPAPAADTGRVEARRPTGQPTSSKPAAATETPHWARTLPRDSAFGGLSFEFRSDRGTNAVYRSGEAMDFTVRAGHDCFLYVLLMDAGGGVKVFLPSSRVPGPILLRGGRTHRLFPELGGQFDMLALPPFGTEVLKAVASTVRLDSALAALRGRGPAAMVAGLRQAAAQGQPDGRFGISEAGYAERAVVITTAP